MAFIDMEAKFDSQCDECEDDISEGDDIVYDTETSKSYCAACGDDILGGEEDREEV